MLSIDDMPQSIRENVVHVDFPEVPAGMGSAMLVTFANGLDASVVTGPFTYGGQNGHFEMAVGRGGAVWETCPFMESDGITGWLTQENLIELLAKVAEYDDAELANARRLGEIEVTEMLGLSVQFGILKLAGLDGKDNPDDYLNADDLGASLGLDPDAVDALRAVQKLFNTATDRLNQEHLAALVAEDERKADKG